MSYTVRNFKTKKELKTAVAMYQRHTGPAVRIQRDPIGPVGPGFSGDTWVEGPHSPAPHTWYANVEIENGVVVKVVK